MQRGKERGLKALLTASLPITKGTQPIVTPRPRVSGWSRTAGGDIRVPKPLKVRVEGGERQAETNWYQLALLGTWKNPLPDARSNLEM